MLPVDDVECTIWSPSILEQFSQKHGAAWDALRGLHQVRVAAHHPDGEHPHRNHGREVKRGDAGTNPDGQTVRVRVHVLCNGGQGFPKHQGCDAAGVLDHL